jgi:protein required for attachment to host cells
VAAGWRWYGILKPRIELCEDCDRIDTYDRRRGKFISIEQEDTMHHILVAAMNGTKARFLTLEPASLTVPEAGMKLVEQDSLLNAENELLGQDLWSTSKTGRNRSTSGQSHSYDDHREQHCLEFEKRFANQITHHIAQLVQTREIQKLLLVSEPQFLGLMRESLVGELPTRLEVTELAKSIAQMTVSQIHQYLAEQTLLPLPQRLERSIERG